MSIKCLEMAEKTEKKYCIRHDYDEVYLPSLIKTGLCSKWWFSELTILDGDLALTVLGSKYRLIASSLLNHSAHGPLAVGTVIGRVLAQL